MSIRHRIRTLKNEIKWAFQRMFRGYDDRAVWNINTDFIDRYTKTLNLVINDMHSHPAIMTEDEWKEILSTMMYYLTHMSEDFYIENHPEMSYQEYSEEMKHNKDEFFKLFTEYFYNLWD